VRSLALFGVLAILALLLQTAVLPLLTFGRGAPDLLLILCVYFGLRIHSVGGAIGAFVLGYLQDAVSGSIVGINAFAMSLVYAGVYLTSRHLWVDNAISKIVVVFCAAVVKTAAVLMLVTLFVAGGQAWSTRLPQMTVEAVLAALFSPPVFAILARTQELAVIEEP
jgi:rod shape-determining protein MreD